MSDAKADSHSSESQDDLDLTKEVASNFDMCNELVQQQLILGRRLKEKVEQDDRKCNLMRFKLQDLKKQHGLAETTTSTLRKNIVVTQMELEKISHEVATEKENMENKFPTTGLEYYTEMITVISHMIEHVKQFEEHLNGTIEECTMHNDLIDRQKMSILEILKKIHSLANEKKNLTYKFESNSAAVDVSLNSFNIEENTNLLKEEFKKFNALKSMVADFDARRVTSESKRVEQSVRCQEMKDNLIKLHQNYDELYTHDQAELDDLKTQRADVEDEAKTACNDFDSELEKVELLFKNLELQSCNAEEELETLISRENCLRNLIDEKEARIEEMPSKKKDILKLKDELKESEVSDRAKLDTLNHQIGVLETEISEIQANLTGLKEEELHLQAECETWRSKQKDSSDSEETLLAACEERQRMLNAQLLRKEKLESDVTCFDEKIREFELRKNQLELQLENYDKLADNLAHVLEREKNEAINNTIRKRDYLTQQISARSEYINTLAESTYENQLFVDAIEDAVHLGEKFVVSAHLELWSANKKNDDLKVQLNQSEKRCLEERMERDNQHQLLQNLEKNSFPKNQIPDEWFQSFRKETDEFENYEKQRSKLEEKRDKLKKKLGKLI